MTNWQLPDPESEREVKNRSWIGFLGVAIAIGSVLVAWYIILTVASHVAMMPVINCTEVTNETQYLSSANASWCEYNNTTGRFQMSSKFVWNTTTCLSNAQGDFC